MVGPGRHLASLRHWVWLMVIFDLPSGRLSKILRLSSATSCRCLKGSISSSLSLIASDRRFSIKSRCFSSSSACFRRFSSNSSAWRRPLSLRSSLSFRKLFFSFLSFLQLCFFAKFFFSLKSFFSLLQTEFASAAFTVAELLLELDRLLREVMLRDWDDADETLSTSRSALVVPHLSQRKHPLHHKGL